MPKYFEKLLKNQKRACGPCLGIALAYVPFGNSKLNINAFSFLFLLTELRKGFSNSISLSVCHTSWNSYQPSFFQVFQTWPGEVSVKILNLMVGSWDSGTLLFMFFV